MTLRAVLLALGAVASLLTAAALIATAVLYVTSSPALSDEGAMIHIDGPTIAWHVGLGAFALILAVVLAVATVRTVRRRDR